MANTFTNAIIREIGRNFGKTVSNSLLGDTHSTPYRRVGSYSVLGRASGGYKYENQLDRLIKTFQIKGKIATFNSAQNIFNAYFELVEEANKDGINYVEALYLVRQYDRTVKALNNISNALIELDDKDKSQKVNTKIIQLSDFMNDLDKVFKEIPVKHNAIPKTKINAIYGLIIIIILIGFSPLIISQTQLYRNIVFIILLMFVFGFGLIIGPILHNSYKKDVKKEANRVKTIESIRNFVSIAANAVKV